MNLAATLSSLVVSRSSFVIALLTLFTLTLTSPVYAQNDVPCPTNLPAKATVDQLNRDAITGNEYDDKVFNLNQITGTTDSLLNLLTGCSQLHPSTNDATAGTGALAASGKLVAALYAVPPASGVTYFAQKLENLNPVQPAYAQNPTGGIGFSALQPVQNIWTAFRNISYVGFVIVFVIIGFMVMFRAHISPQAVATVQDSIPRLVIALILVTFSYAIAGLMIDIMFLFLNIIINALEQQNLIPADGAKYIFNRSVFGAVFGSMGDIVKDVFNGVSGILSSLIQLGFIGKIFGALGGGIVGIIASIAMLFIMFRVFLMLLTAYVTIIILTIAAPFFFLIQALPGNNSANMWFKQMASNVAVFPAVALMFVLAGILGGIESLGGIAGKTAFTAGDVGQFPLLYGDLNLKDIGHLIAFGFILMTPSAAQIIKDAIGVKGGPNLGPGMATMGAAAGLAAFPAKYAWNRRQERRRNERMAEAFNRGGAGPRGNQPGGEPAVGTGH